MNNSINNSINCLNLVYILVIVVLIFMICSMLTLDHFKPINSLKIKYNANKVVVPKQFKKKTNEELSKTEQINSELSSHPLSFSDQMYSFDKFPHVGPIQSCNDKSDCQTITSDCKNGYCVVSSLNNTAFGVSY